MRFFVLLLVLLVVPSLVLASDNGSCDCYGFVRADDVVSIAGGLVDSKGFALKSNIVDKNELSEYVSKDEFYGLMELGLKDSFEDNGVLAYIVDNDEDSKGYSLVDFIPAGILFIYFIWLGYLTWRVYSE